MQIIIFEEEEVKDTSMDSSQKLDFSQKASLIKDLIGPVPYTTTYMKTLHRIRQSKTKYKLSFHHRRVKIRYLREMYPKKREENPKWPCQEETVV